MTICHPLSLACPAATPRLGTHILSTTVHAYHADAAIHAVALPTLTRVVAHDNDALADAEGYEAYGERAKSVGHSASLKDTWPKRWLRPLSGAISMRSLPIQFFRNIDYNSIVLTIFYHIITISN